MATKYFAMKHETKPRDHGKKQEGHGRQYGNQPDSQPDKQLDQQFHPGKCLTTTNTSNSSNPISKSNPPSTTQSTKATTEKTTNGTITASYYTRDAAVSDQNIWYINCGAIRTIIFNKI